MKKYFGINPVLIVIFFIFLILNLIELLKPQSEVQSNLDLTLQENLRAKPTELSRDNLFYDLNLPKESEIYLFTTKKWYKDRGGAASNHKQPSESMSKNKTTRSINQKNFRVSSNSEKNITENKGNVIEPVLSKELDENPRQDIVSKKENPTQSIEQGQQQYPSEGLISGESSNIVAEPREIEIKYLGRYRENNLQYIFLDINGESRAVALGHMINDEVKLSSIEADSVQLFNLRTGKIQTIDTE